MKTTDLMIGDWVLISVWDCNPFPSKVTSVNYNSYRGKDYVDWIDTEDEEELGMYAVQPIPLTPEILEKNGFKYSEWYGWQIKEPDFTLCFVGDTPHFLLDDIFVCDCPYVHTLQHALKLCGIEKEIVL